MVGEMGVCTILCNKSKPTWLLKKGKQFWGRGLLFGAPGRSTASHHSVSASAFIIDYVDVQQVFYGFLVCTVRKHKK